ncbi:MAG: pyridoxal-dependent decarboxylase [Candidatus Saccharibacteria bacterium]
MADYDEYFLPLDNLNEQRKLFNDLLDICFDFYSGKTRNNRFLNYKSSEELKEIVSEDMPRKGTGLKSAINILNNEVGKYSIAQFDDNYLAFPDSGNAVPAILADIYSKFINQNMIAVSRSAPIATFIEIQLIEWLRQLIGFEHKSLNKVNSLTDVSGMVTTGGHMSNHIAILAALNHAFPEIKKKGISSINEQPAIILAGSISHYSFSSALHHLGIGQDGLLVAGSTKDYKINIKDVEELLINPPVGKRPFMVVGVAGNTRTTSIDNLLALAKLCKKHKVWFHIDACHGGALLFSSTYRKMLAGMEQSDSVSLDPHKGLFLPYPLSFVMFKKRDTLTQFTRYEDDVRNGLTWDLGYINPFYGSRGSESLKLWLMIKTMGLDILEKVIDDRQKNAKFASDLIRKSGYFSIFNEMSFYRLAFVYFPNSVRQVLKNKSISISQKVSIKNLIDYYTHNINEELYTTGSLCMDEFKLDDLSDATKLCLKEKFVVMSITIGNPRQNTTKIRKSLDILFDKCAYYESQFTNDINEIIEYNKDHGNTSDRPYGPAGWQ